MSALTIGMFADSYLPEINGVVTSIVGTVRALRRRGHRVIVVAPAHEGAVDDDPDVFRLRSAPFPFYPQFRMAFPLPAKVLATLPRVPFDVVHAHSMFFIGCLGAYLARFRKAPLFFTYHTRWTEYAHYLPQHQGLTRAQAVWVSREFSNRCDLVIAPTAGIVDLLISYGVERPIDVIPTGVDLQSFAGADESAVARIRGDGGPIALFVGRLGKEKNVDLVLDAFALAAQRIPQARLIIVGGGPHEAELREHAAALPCAQRIRFTGLLDQASLSAYYRAADLFVFGSTTETQGLVLLEAMAHGVPVVATDCPVSRDVVTKDAGILVPQDPRAFANAVESILCADASDRALRSAAARAAADPYSVDALAAVLERRYLEHAARRAAVT